MKVEVDSYSGGMMTRFSIVGLPDNAVKESQERVFAALRINGFQMSKRSIVVNLAPADLRKEGTGLDLPIVKELVEQMGGTIELQSEPGKGKSFFVTIPCKLTSLDKKAEMMI